MMRSPAGLRCLLGGLLVWLAAVPLFAQDDAARALLDRVAGQMAGSNGLEMVFAIAVPGGGLQEGTLCLKADKFRLEAAGATTWFDGRTQWTYVEGTGEVSVTEPGEAELQAIHPHAWMSLYREGYRCSLSAAPPAADTKKIVMTATTPRQEVQSVELLIDSRTLWPRQVSMVRRGESAATVIKVSGCTDNRRYPDSLFVFDAASYPHAEVIDLR